MPFEGFLYFKAFLRKILMNMLNCKRIIAA
jgi:hypothetical protein